VLTVDAPMLGNRERDTRNNFTLPPHLQMRNFLDVGLEDMPEAESGSALQSHAKALFDVSLTWEALDWLRSITHLLVIGKGIVTAEDATLAVEHGAAVVVVSNHGGRQLDSAIPTIMALPEVVRAVAGRAEVYVEAASAAGRTPSRRWRWAHARCSWAVRPCGGWPQTAQRAWSTRLPCSARSWSWRWRSAARLLSRM
jgi:hypothetical protein